MDEVEMGRVLAGAVQAVKPYGVFVRPAWGLDRATVLVPTRLLANFFIQTPEDVLDVDQTLFVRQKTRRNCSIMCVNFF
jgi:ribosomal protein S1